jgi:hypothetical protein
VCSSKRIRVSVEINRPAASMNAPESKPRPRDPYILLAVVVDADREPPTGHVHHGAVRWHFCNRVELLEAIDTACAVAVRETNRRRRT